MKYKPHCLLSSNCEYKHGESYMGVWPSPVDGTGLENRRRETVRGFKSYRPRQRDVLIFTIF